MSITKTHLWSFACLILLLIASPSWAACRDAVVLVHGNAATSASFDKTYNALIARGWSAHEIFRPSWGNKLCAACNDHNGSEEEPVQDALLDAIEASCTGKIDIIGHSMGVTLAAKQIVDYNLSGYVDTFVGIAGAMRGLWSCGTYPYNVVTSTCGYWGLSVNSPVLRSLANKKLGARMYSIKSYIDQIVCYGGICTVGGRHSSQIDNETASYTYAYGHFGLQTDTASKQVDLIQ